VGLAYLGAEREPKWTDGNAKKGRKKKITAALFVNVEEGWYCESAFISKGPDRMLAVVVIHDIRNAKPYVKLISINNRGTDIVVWHAHQN